MFDVCVLFLGHKLKIQIEESLKILLLKFTVREIKIHKKVMGDTVRTRGNVSFVIESSHACALMSTSRLDSLDFDCLILRY
jgi:hypothetical protein